jgi:hypothetical protein
VEPAAGELVIDGGSMAASWFSNQSVSGQQSLAGSVSGDSAGPVPMWSRTHSVRSVHTHRAGSVPGSSGSWRSHGNMSLRNQNSDLYDPFTQAP